MERDAVKIPPEVRSKYSLVDDVDPTVFLDLFDEPPGCKTMEVGAHDEPTANMLSESGFDVYGVDVREYDVNLPPLNYTYLRGDFCDLPSSFLREHLGTFDCIYSLSAIEHFGLGVYGEGMPSKNYDILAMRMMWHLLKEGGTTYITVPFGGTYVDYRPDWRVYTYEKLYERIVQDFTIKEMRVIVSGDVTVGGQCYKMGGGIDPLKAFCFNGDPPHLSMFLKMRKMPVKRLSPNGK